MEVLVACDGEGGAGEEFITLVEGAVAQTLRQEDGEDFRVEVVLATDERLRELNREFRGLDWTTDVLSFYLGPPTPDDPLLGEIVISLDRALQQAGDYGHSLEREVAFLAVHGTLHLLGYDHEDREDEARMSTCAEKVMDTLNLGRR